MLSTIACIPAFNEATGIAKLIKKTLEYVDGVIVCDDGSTDDTAQIAKLAGATVIKHEKNHGKGYALRSLFEHSLENDADIIVTIDGDGQFLPEEIPFLLKSLEENHLDIVVGYRFGDKTEMPKYRKVGNKLLDSVTKLASDIGIRDTQSGFRCYTRKAIELIQFKNNGFAADSEILINASKKGLSIGEQKVTVIYNTGMRTSTQNPAYHFSHVAGSLIEMIAIHHPLVFLGIPGLVSLLIGIGFTINVIMVFNEFRLFSLPQTIAGTSFSIIGLMLILVSTILYGLNRILSRNQ